MSKFGRYRVIDPLSNYKGFDRLMDRGVFIDELEAMGFVFASVPEPYSLDKPKDAITQPPKPL